jgi:hypothetical protein
MAAPLPTTSSEVAIDSDSSASYLTPLGLTRYVAVIDEAGGESPSDIADFTQAELIEQFGMKRLHAKKLRKWLDTLDAAAGGEATSSAGSSSPNPAGGGAAATKQSGAAIAAATILPATSAEAAAPANQSAVSTGSAALVFSRVGVSFDAMRSLVETFRTATRWLLEDGVTTRVGVAIINRTLVLERPSGAKV